MKLSHNFSSDSRPVTGKLIPDQYTHIKYKFEQGGLLVYDFKSKTSDFEQFPNYSPYSLKCFKVESTYTLEIPADDITLRFNSKFECGNLLKAIKLSDYEYNLFLKCDNNSPNHNHWYYFSVWNPRRTSITFNICNMKKSDPLYALGMKPSVWSCKSKEFENLEWHRGGNNISHTLNTNSLYTLKYTYSFKYENDTVYFAYAKPFSYTDLANYLTNIKSNYSNISRINTLCESFGKLKCEYLTITEDIEDYLDYENEVKDMNQVAKHMARYKKTRTKNISKIRIPEKHQEKKGIVLMARVHSGETVSSYMLNGALDFILSDSKTAIFLRKNFVFKIIPMLNPDGVYIGNYRCCLNGIDLNRVWLKPDKSTFPTIYYSKLMINTFALRHQVMMICDFHGHTKKRDVFMYGCSIKPEIYQDIRNNLLARVVPYYIYSKNRFFSFQSSHYRVEKYKESTSRIVFFKDFQIPHSYTMEASFFGSKRDNSHFSSQDLASLGKDLCRFCVAFSKNSMYLNWISLTNNFIQNIKLSQLTAKSLIKDAVVSPPEEKLQKKNDLEHNIIKEDDEEVVIAGEILNKSSSSDDEIQEKIDENRFWSEVELANCLPDKDSSGSDSDSIDKQENEEEKMQSYLEETHIERESHMINAPSEKLTHVLDFSESPNKSSKIDRFMRKQRKKSKKNSQSVSLSANKKNNESLILQTFQFPDTEIETKNRKLFEPLRASANLKSMKQSSLRSPTAEKKSSLGFLPALVAVNTSYTHSKRTNTLQSFSGLAEQLSKYIHHTSHFRSKK